MIIIDIYPLERLDGKKRVCRCVYGCISVGNIRQTNKIVLFQAFMAEEKIVSKQGSHRDIKGRRLDA